MDFELIVLVAILIEAVWENLKLVIKNKKPNVSMIVVLILSIIVCLAFSIDIFAVVGLKSSIPYIGSILTGIVVSRGANVVNDLISRLQGIKK